MHALEALRETPFLASPSPLYDSFHNYLAYKYISPISASMLTLFSPLGSGYPFSISHLFLRNKNHFIVMSPK